MYYKILDFKNDWGNESKATLKILNTLTDESLNQKVYAEGRTLCTLAWHIVVMLSSMPGHAGLMALNIPNTLCPTEAKSIVDEYEKD